MAAPSTEDRGKALRQAWTDVSGREFPEYYGWLRSALSEAVVERSDALLSTPHPTTPDAQVQDARRVALERAVELLWEHVPGLAPHIEELEAALSAQVAAEPGGWRPSIGDAVQASDAFLNRYGNWRGVQLYVVGLRVEPNVEGLNVTVAEEWPLMHGGDASLTDGFFVGRPDCPDDLVPTPPAQSGEIEPPTQVQNTDEGGA